MSEPYEDRRSNELSGLDIDRRKTDGRRDDKRRPWLGNAYEEIYISSYVNAIHPAFPSKVHAFSNLEGDAELSSAEWAVANLAILDAETSASLRSLRSFASELIKRGLVVDDDGKPVISEGTAKVDQIDHYLLKTGS